ncbi:MAG: type II toxin-antitoxin system VapC family toxin [Candidatus Woesearchaeota archaeon]|jgi:predicted nucleic acid-binding protein
MEKVCVDTGVLTEYLLNKKEIVEKIIQLEKTAELAVTPQIIFELFCFAEASEKPEENKQVIHDLVLRLTTLDWTVDAAAAAAKVFTELNKTGKKVNLREVFLGVLAIENKYMLYTDNPEAYEGIGVKIYK